MLLYKSIIFNFVFLEKNIVFIIGKSVKSEAKDFGDKRQLFQHSFHYLLT